MKLAGIAVAVAACGGDDGPALPPPIAEIPGTLQKLAVNDTSMFSIDTDTGDLLELGLDGTLIGTLR
jgi:hypothetical protein